MVTVGPITIFSDVRSYSTFNNGFPVLSKETSLYFQSSYCPYSSEFRKIISRLRRQKLITKKLFDCFTRKSYLTLLSTLCNSLVNMPNCQNSLNVVGLDAMFYIGYQ